MNLKVKKSNRGGSYSPRNNWKFSSKWIGSILVNWLRPSKEEHPRMQDFNWPNLGTSMVPMIKRLWMLGLLKWRITCMPPRLDDIQLWNLPNFKAMPPHGGGQWDKRRGRTMVTLGNFLRNELKPSLFQGIPITSRGVNSTTLWMPQMITCGNMWGLIPNSCWRSGTCMNWIVCANLWWDFQLGPSESLRKIGSPHYPRPSWKWKASRIWDGVKNLGSRGTTSSLTRSHAMKENETEGKGAQGKKNLNNSKAWGSNPRKILWRKGLPSKGANPREMLVGSLRGHASITTKWGTTPKIIPSPK